MQYYLDSVRLSLKSGNHFGAIFMSLTLPDICASIDSKKNKTSRSQYYKWFNLYLEDTYTQCFKKEGITKNIFRAEECYAIRCSFLHQGTHKIKQQECLGTIDEPIKSVNFMSLEKGFYLKNDDILFLDVDFFCSSIIDAVEKWLLDIEHDDTKIAKIKDMPITHRSFQSLCNINQQL